MVEQLRTSGTEAFRYVASRPSIVAVSLAAAAILGVVVGTVPLAGVAVVVAAAGLWLTAEVAAKPHWAALIYAGATPLLVGLQRGLLIPVVRLNEALLALLWFGVLLGPVRRWALGGYHRPLIHTLDIAVVALAFFSSVTTLLWMYGRGVAATLDDLLYALNIWKYAAVYFLFRLAVRTEQTVRRVVDIVVWACVPVAILGLLQALGVEQVLSLLQPFASEEFPETIANRRASSTIGAPIPFADVMVIALALAVGRIVFIGSRTPLDISMPFLFGLAAVASGQVSGVLTLVIAVLAIGKLLNRLGLAVGALALGGVGAAVLLAPVISARLASDGGGIPSAWTGESGRLGNLATYVWPELSSGLNWLFGVRTAARIPAPESWRDWIYIESGYAWLLWNGGVPLLLAFVAFAYYAFKASRPAGRKAPPGIASVRLAAVSILTAFVVLMAVDTHLTLRGAADMLFLLLGICVSVGGVDALEVDGRPEATMSPSVPR
ncbi:hypothetical protein ACI799_12415 [Blastococcus sp. SYSU DS0753]